MDPMHLSLTPMGGGVNIDIDLAVVIQLGLFVVLMFLLTQMVFKPFLAGIDAREKKTDAARDDAEALKARAATLQAEHHERLARARAEAAAVRQDLRVEGVRSKDGAVGEARAAAAASIAEAHEKASAAYDAGRSTLLLEVDGLSRLVVEKVLGRGV